MNWIPVESTKQYLYGFRMPDLKRLWYGSDEDCIDGQKIKPKPLFLRFEAFLVKLQELSLWTDPKSSIIALASVHLLYWYLLMTSNSPIYLLVNIALLTFVYTTWTERIWPAIRVPEADPGPEPEWTPVSPDVLSAPELVQLWEDFHSKLCHGLTWLKNLRQEQPGKFCAITSTFFFLLAMVGSRITTLGLLYYISVGYLTLPGVMKLLVKYPAVQCMLETMNDYKKESQKTEEIIEQPKETSTELTLADSVYAKLQSGLNVVSNLNLKSGLAALSQEDDESYIPEEDEANQSILESALNSSTRDPMQAHNLDQEEIADSSLEYASLLPVQGEVMPDDELDANNPLINTADDYDEFLPSSSTAAVTSQKSLFKLQYEDEDDEDDEFASSLMAAAQASGEISLTNEPAEEPSSVIRKRRRTSPDSDLDDFELISGDELAEVSP